MRFPAIKVTAALLYEYSAATATPRIRLATPSSAITVLRRVLSSFSASNTSMPIKGAVLDTRIRQRRWLRGADELMKTSVPSWMVMVGFLSTPSDGNPALTHAVPVQTCKLAKVLL